ncbi:bifunctional nicotinamidase/pyrazinamidase [Salegentibacter sp. JZCK2]|uniref:bifunctional nicotinamidase/pyrazinamidase n=1 Tax=Salegentibacter tibetensis TaxID=2873600 RepID=UPI001CCF1D88|nr:bifunctional nicotinamidase/pyrazinamidase [Salegentibacter tibetensis]MBZ9728251.1 bifunctional nicotinamidase/pyrazinamidase [Salegentibacter tibetensis]
MKTLIIVDPQNDFMPGGSLAVPNGDEIIPVINKLQKKFDLVIASQDWHPKAHASFASSHMGKKEFETIDLNGTEQVMWPEHCVQNTDGAEFNENLKTAKIEAIFRKGTNPEIDSYSAFYDNKHLKSTGLTGYLKEKKADDLYFCGLAAEICVYFTAKDAIKEGFKATIIEDATRALDAEDFKKAKAELEDLGGKIITAEAIEN